MCIAEHSLVGTWEGEASRGMSREPSSNGAPERVGFSARGTVDPSKTRAFANQVEEMMRFKSKTRK
jgi:hypothetical protein